MCARESVLLSIDAREYVVLSIDTETICDRKSMYSHLRRCVAVRMLQCIAYAPQNCLRARQNMHGS